LKSANNRKYKSIHLHLLYHYVFAVMILLSLIGVAFYWETVNVIHQADHEFVVDELSDLQKALHGKQIKSPLKAHNSFQHFLIQDRRILMAILFAGALLSLLVGVLITRRGLRSLDELTETVRTITTSSLGKRVDPESLPKELSSLGQAFNQMLDRIEASFSRLKQMSADMSHELRTPIMNLIGQTELLLSYAHSDTDYRGAQASNLEELQRMASIIENILFLARAENPQIELTKYPISASDEIENICDYYQAAADEKQIQFIRQGEGILHADPVMFRRLMSNIVSNAVKYTREKGIVTICVAEKDEKLEVTVEDTGIGIDAAHLPKLFDRFYRVDVSRTLEARGSGLGLAIAKSIVDLHRGDIWVVSELGVGSKINISLPLR